MGTVVAFPRSGYANRLQTIVSAALLAEELGMDLKVCWLPQVIAPVHAEDVFSSDFIRDRIISATDTERIFGLSIEDIPRYLHTSTDRSCVYLAGHDHGEQYFMPDLKRMIAEHPPEIIAIVAGGKFTLDGDRQLTTEQDNRFRHLRFQAYKSVHLHPMIEDAVSRHRDRHEGYLGLHLRYSDRNMQAPWSWRIKPEVERLATETGILDIFVASDSRAARDAWVKRLTRSGLSAWGTRPESLNRRDATSALGALVDWRLLAQSTAMTYFQESSFAEEACVASGAFDKGRALPASPLRARLVIMRKYAHSLSPFPLRHGSLARGEHERN